MTQKTSHKLKIHEPGTIEIKVTGVDRIHKKIKLEICNPDSLDEPIKASLKIEDWISIQT